jgi:hypothetical protein
MPITINRKIVDKISGPVSTYIFEPTEKNLENNPYAPIFILFGDWHLSSKNYCDPNEGDGNDYKIFDINFLKLFSDLVEVKEEKEENGTVDFYLEGGPFHLKRIDKSPWPTNTPMHDLWIMFKDCYYNKRMETEPLNMEMYKQIKNIRWQSGDIRFFPTEMIHLSVFIEIFINNIDTNKRLIFKDNMNGLNKYIIKYLRQNICIYSEFKDEILNTEFTEEKFIEKNIKNVSLIRKQLLKCGNKKEKIEEQCIKYVKSIYEKYLNDSVEELHEVHEEVLSLFKNDPYSSEADKYLDNIRGSYMDGTLKRYLQALKIVNSMKLDLYSLVRSFKIMTSIEFNKQKDTTNYSLPPLINIFYFGDLHIENIRQFLSTNGYKELVTISNTPFIETNNTDEINRCIDFKKYNTKLEAIIEILINKRNSL